MTPHAIAAQLAPLDERFNSNLICLTEDIIAALK